MSATQRACRAGVWVCISALAAASGVAVGLGVSAVNAVVI